jgi:hypothetical protein
MFHGRTFPPGAETDEGDDINEMIKRWRYWINECVTFLLDGDGNFLRFKYPGSYGEQPKVHMSIYLTVRRRWVANENARIQKQMAAAKKGKR